MDELAKTKIILAKVEIRHRNQNCSIDCEYYSVYKNHRSCSLFRHYLKYDAALFALRCDKCIESKKENGDD